MRLTLSLAFLGALVLSGAACSSSDETPGNPSVGGHGGISGSGGSAQGGTGGISDGGTGGISDGGTGGISDGGTGGISDGGTGGAQDYLPGDEMAAWEGGPSYYGAWASGPPTDPSFFPIAVWLQDVENTSKATQYRDIGVNMHIGLWNGPTEAQLAAATALPTRVFAEQNAVGLGSPNNAVIKAWMHQDEPDNAQNGTEDPVPTSTVTAGYAAMVAADATRPVYLNLGQGVASDEWYGRGHRTGHPEDYAEYAKGADILSFDIYPMNVFPADAGAADWVKAYTDAVAQDAWLVATGVDRLRAWTNYEKPVWAWIETTNMNGHDGFALTPELVKAEVWMALVHGARGIGYFCHVFSPTFIEAGFLADPDMTTGIQAIDEQIASLAPVLNTQSVSNAVTTKSSDAAVPVDTMVKRADGTTYVFAVGMRPSPTTATFTLRAFSGAATVEVVGESRSLPAADGAFQDAFAGYGVHIYRVANP